MPLASKLEDILGRLDPYQCGFTLSPYHQWREIAWSTLLDLDVRHKISVKKKSRLIQSSDGRGSVLTITSHEFELATRVQLDIVDLTWRMLVDS
jgi:hypothetical protein